MAYSSFVTLFDPGKPTCEFHWRPGVSWDIDAMREMDEHVGEQWLLYELLAIQDGKVTCGGCRKPFASTNDAVLVTIWDGSVSHNRIEGVSYCLDCVRQYGEEIAGPVATRLNG